MLNPKHRHLKILLIALALLGAQFAVLAHGLDHPFHKTTEACQVYTVLDQTGHGLSFSAAVVLPLIPTAYEDRLVIRRSLSRFRVSYSIRAPPIFA